MPDDTPGPRSDEHRRLDEAERGEKAWRAWGPYLSERQWGTVREDYSPDGQAWTYLPHDHARSRAYRWGEDGIAGISDERQFLCFAPALWNGRDPILKERLFGLANGEGNHGEDVKELYYHLDATPTHSYLKYLYRYPLAEFPYGALRTENARRDRTSPEYDLLDTGILDGSNYADLVVEYAKGDPDDIHILLTVINRSGSPAALHVIPQLWFRNVWSWDEAAEWRRPSLSPLAGEGAVAVDHPALEPYWFAYEGSPEPLFCDNDTNAARLFGVAAAPGLFKDGFHDRIVGGDLAAVGPAGTKCGLWYRLDLPPGGSATIRLRLAASATPRKPEPDDATIRMRRSEADRFYEVVQAGIGDPDARLIQRQAFAGMIWSKQYYRYDVRRWLEGDPAQPSPSRERIAGRNADWRHVDAADILSMPDAWEYPWFAAWDLAFQCLPFALIDPAFAKDQLLILTRERYMHPNGQIPAYEWEFGDANPPVHAWAAWRVFEIDRARRGGVGDDGFLERVFHKLMINFTWWVNRKDYGGRNVFQGGFLGLDNVGVFDRSHPPEELGRVTQADGTAWMAMYALNLMRIALSLARRNPAYEDIATKFFEHFLLIAEAMTAVGTGGRGLWNEEDGFYYDQIERPDGRVLPLRMRSIVGLVPLFAVEVIEPDVIARHPAFARRLDWLLTNRPELARLVSRWQEPGMGNRTLLSLLRGHRMKALLHRMLDESEFLSPHGVRSLSKVYADQPFRLYDLGAPISVRYAPAESESGLFGGNSNWRGPVWFPLNYLLIESLRRFQAYYGDDFQVECPTGSGTFLTIAGVADELTRRLTGLFRRDANGARPMFGDDPRMRDDPLFADLLLFHEYFDGDTGRGLGASHQTGWTGLVANLLGDVPP